MPEAVWELLAIKYAHHARTAHENFVFRDVHDGPMPLDFFLWVARSPERIVVIDTGFSAETGARRGREVIREPKEGLGAIGIEAAHVEDVILTHLHYDHVGAFDIFPRARFHLQDREMAYATGRYMCHGRIQTPFDIETITGMVRNVYAGRVAFHDGAGEIAPGIAVQRVGGHSDGLQIVRVRTARGWVVVASDATHFYAHMESGNPFPIVFNVGDMLEGHRTCRRLAESDHHVVPGHDPLVLERYPPLSRELEGVVCRLDVMPRS
jgi:glyoxylase-like metal-dependent hydrolase (beta-lactamase superfamily II)